MFQKKSLACLMGLVAAVAILTGCRSNQNAPKPKKLGKLTILSDREVVPAPYRSPQFVQNGAAAQAGSIPQIAVTGGDEDAADNEMPEFTPAATVEAPAVQPTYDYPKDNLSPKPQPVAGSRRTYKVVKGDTLSGIAYMYQISWRDLAAENNMTDKSVLKEGAVLVLPEGAAENPRPRQAARPAAKSTTTKPAQTSKGTAAAGSKSAPKIAQKPIPADGYYTTVSGDSLWTISRRFGLKDSDIQALNPKVNFNKLYVNQKIKLVDGKSAPKAEPKKAEPPKAEPKKQDAPKPPEPPIAPVAPVAPAAPVAPVAPAPAPEPAPAPAPAAEPAPAPAPAAEPAAAPAVPAPPVVPTVPTVNEIPGEAPITPAPAADNAAEEPKLP